MRIIFFVLVLCFVSMLGGQVRDSEIPELRPGVMLDSLRFGAEGTLEIMTWNLQNFPKHAFTVDYAAEIILAADPDLVGLQEITSEEGFLYLIQKLNEIDNRNTWQGHKSISDEWGHNLAYLYKSNLLRVNSVQEIYPAEEYDYAFPRRPLIMEFHYHDQNVLVINNHLKAFPGKENEARRSEAVRLLHEYIRTDLNDENVIIIGDLNDYITDPDSVNVFNLFLNQPDEYLFTDYEIAADTLADWSYPYWKYRGHIDHILISNELFDEFEATGRDVKTVVIDRFMEGGEDSRYQFISDHRPVTARFRFVIDD
ncbi:MAG: endonuclease/exonuclease/phosphatase family protein [Candidatus Cloacimonetes bacterium]|nr:endonuclease/exonuclease/phosphatase family protein [Candidatus Cloacimonadota bacterium]